MRPATATVSAVGFEGLGCGLAPLGAHLGDGVRGREPVGIGRLAQLHDLFQFCLAQVEETALKFRIEHGTSFFVNCITGSTVSISSDWAAGDWVRVRESDHHDRCDARSKTVWCGRMRSGV